MLVSERPGRARRRLLIRAGAFAAVALVTAGLAALLFASESGNRAEIDTTDAALAAYEQMGKGLPLDPVDDADMPRMDPLLNAARALPYGYDAAAPGGLRFGLSQQAKLGARLPHRLPPRRRAGAAAAHGLAARVPDARAPSPSRPLCTRRRASTSCWAAPGRSTPTWCASG